MVSRSSGRIEGRTSTSSCSVCDGRAAVDASTHGRAQWMSGAYAYTWQHCGENIELHAKRKRESCGTCNGRARCKDGREGGRAGGFRAHGGRLVKRARTHPALAEPGLQCLGRECYISREVSELLGRGRRMGLEGIGEPVQLRRVCRRLGRAPMAMAARGRHAAGRRTTTTVPTSKFRI